MRWRHRHPLRARRVIRLVAWLITQAGVLQERAVLAAGIGDLDTGYDLMDQADRCLDQAERLLRLFDS